MRGFLRLFVIYVGVRKVFIFRERCELMEKCVGKINKRGSLWVNIVVEGNS